MRKIVLLSLILVALCSCATYKPSFPRPDDRVNPYDQKNVPDDGLAGFARDIIKGAP